MKKFLLIIFAVIGFAISASGQVAQCRVSGTNDGSTASASIESYDSKNKKVTVGFYNDSDQSITIIANVYNGNNLSISVTEIVQPRQSKSKTVDWPWSWEPTFISVKSSKCE